MLFNLNNYGNKMWIKYNIYILQKYENEKNCQDTVMTNWWLKDGNNQWYIQKVEGHCRLLEKLLIGIIV